jgi:hypothetical protein
MNRGVDPAPQRREQPDDDYGSRAIDAKADSPDNQRGEHGLPIGPPRSRMARPISGRSAFLSTAGVSERVVSIEMPTGIGVNVRSAKRAPLCYRSKQRHSQRVMALCRRARSFLADPLDCLIGMSGCANAGGASGVKSRKLRGLVGMKVLESGLTRGRRVDRLICENAAKSVAKAAFSTRPDVVRDVSFSVVAMSVGRRSPRLGSLS